MPLRQTKFSSAWLSSIDCNGQRLSEWCKKGKDDYHAFCCFCDMDIKCDNAGKAQLLQHCTKKKHQEAVKYSVDKRQSKLFVSTKQGAASSTDMSYGSVRVINYGDASLEAEVYWLAKLASDNYSL